MLARVFSVVFLAALALVLPGAAGAQEIEYSDIDYATVRVIVMGEVELEAIKKGRIEREFALVEGGHGSGVVVSEEGLIVTAAHVVDDARLVAVQIPGRDAPLPATVVHQDEELDFAVLEIPHRPKRVAKLAPDGVRLKTRQSVFAIGYPLDVTRADPQSSRGVVSGALPSGQLQLDISVNPGNSGGPVLDEEDNVCGIVVARSDPTKGALGLAVAVPIQAIKDAIASASASRNPQTSAHNQVSYADAQFITMAAEGGYLRPDLVNDSEKFDEAMDAINKHLSKNENSSHVLLLAASILWNKVVLGPTGSYARQRHRARLKDLVEAAARLDPQLSVRSEFARRVLAGRYQLALSDRKRPAGLNFVRIQVPQGTDKVVRATATRSVSYNYFHTGYTQYRTVCRELPCEAEIRSGSVRLGIKSGSGRALFGNAVRIDEDSQVAIERDSRKGLRITGAVLAAIGVAAVAGGAALLAQDVSDQPHPGGVVLVGAGVVLAGFGFPMLAVRDRVRVSVSPTTGSSSPKVPEQASESDPQTNPSGSGRRRPSAPDGAGLSATFAF